MGRYRIWLHKIRKNKIKISIRNITTEILETKLIKEIYQISKKKNYVWQIWKKFKLGRSTEWKPDSDSGSRNKSWRSGRDDSKSTPAYL